MLPALLILPAMRVMKWKVRCRLLPMHSGMKSPCGSEPQPHLAWHGGDPRDIPGVGPLLGQADTATQRGLRGNAGQDGWSHMTAPDPQTWICGCPLRPGSSGPHFPSEAQAASAGLCVAIT